MKKKIFISGIIILFIICLMIFNIYGNNKYFNDEMIINYSLSKILIEQRDINLEIEKMSSSNEYGIDNPKVMFNPFKISPLTALIIFNTKEESIINVNINDEYIYDMDKTNKHIIPIYGLYEDKTNIITLSIDNKEMKKIEIVTEEAQGVNKLEVIKSKLKLNNDLYFMTSPVGTSASAYDSQGNLKWYLTERFTMDFEWLDNGHFLVGIPETSVADRKIGFVEMDYLGKIYKYYVLEHGYEFEFQILKNGNYMLCGGDKPVFYDRAWIYEIDSKTGELISYLDLYDVFKSVDPDFDDTRLNYRIIRNAFYYNEDNNEIIVSLRGLNSVVSIEYNSKKINYIFAPSGIYSEKFDKYIVSLEEGRYPLGLHSVFITKEGYMFIGWYTEENNEIISTDKVEILNDIELKAKYIKNEFAYTGNYETFIVPKDGYYQLEVWGAQGGSLNKTYYGGYGGYSTGYIYLNKGEALFINVGGRGLFESGLSKGGYNGGGDSIYDTQKYTGSGGGATHISKENGLLSELSSYSGNNDSPILIVAGGGGGASQSSDGSSFGIGGSGGGFKGKNGTSEYNETYIGYGGTQKEGGSSKIETGLFGKGGNASTANSTRGGGGGGGYYGGGSGYKNGAAGGGGSGYIANINLFDKYMVCFECDISETANSATISNTNASLKPINDNSKQGNGYAKITYVGIN